MPWRVVVVEAEVRRGRKKTGGRGRESVNRIIEEGNELDELDELN